MDAGQTPPYQPAPASVEPVVTPPATPVAAPPAPAPKRKMSTGAKWGIGVTIAFILLVFASCVGLTYLGLSGSDPTMSLGDSIAVIHIDGVIAGTGTRAGGYITPEYMLDQLDQAVADDSVKAILLRIDSPGGTVAASQEIAMAVQRASGSKPIVASIGDIGASGAYMVASQCNEIVAAPGSAVGSIGVIMEIPNVSGLLEKLGVEFTVLTTGELKDTGSYFRSVTPTETAMLKAQMGIAYDQFVTDVAQGRDIDEEKVRELATGWVWLGAEAKELGLVDSLGNYDDAIDRAAELGGIEGEPGIVSYEEYDPFSTLLSDVIGLTAKDAGIDSNTLGRLGLPK